MQAKIGTLARGNNGPLTKKTPGKEEEERRKPRMEEDDVWKGAEEDPA
jgi:hypothetical protein